MGTTCTGFDAEATKDEVNEVIGGHLLSWGDGFLDTTYSSNKYANGDISISTRKGEYVVRWSETDQDGPAAVEGRCIVLHDDNDEKTRIGVGKIVCTDTECKASMGPYPDGTAPLPQPNPTPNPPQTTQGSDPGQ